MILVFVWVLAEQVSAQDTFLGTACAGRKLCCLPRHYSSIRAIYEIPMTSSTCLASDSYGLARSIKMNGLLVQFDWSQRLEHGTVEWHTRHVYNWNTRLLARIRADRRIWRLGKDNEC